MYPIIYSVMESTNLFAPTWSLVCLKATTYIFTLSWPVFCLSRRMVKWTIKHITDVHIIQATASPPTTSGEYSCVSLSTNTEMVRTTWFREQPISPFNEWLRFIDLMHFNGALGCFSLGLLRKQSWKLKRPHIPFRPHQFWTHTSNLTKVVKSVLKYMINGTTSISKS